MGIDIKYGQVTLEHPRNIADDEPVFVLRAKDMVAIQLLWDYHQLCVQVGSPKNHLDKIQEVISTFAEWQAHNGVHVSTSTKVPD